ncbi:MAG: FkbM family methyltransferase [bacterium]|nr:FkbM family methyltransferase [bacterium]
MLLFQRGKSAVRRLLLHSRLAWLYGMCGTVYVSLRQRKVIRIYSKQGIWVHRFRDGALTDRHVNHRLSLQRYLHDARDYWSWVYTPRHGDIVVDIGAGKGEDVPYFACAVGPSGRVLAVEAHPATFQCAAVLCRENGWTHVTPIHAAVCDRTGDVIIDNPASDIMSRLTASNDGLRIPGYTLDRLLENHAIKRIDFLKMNIEGAERDALRGMEQCLPNIRRLCISCHDFLADRPHGSDALRTKYEVSTFLRDRGFRIVSRDADPRPYIRDQVNAINERFDS